MLISWKRCPINCNYGCPGLRLRIRAVLCACLLSLLLPGATAVMAAGGGSGFSVPPAPMDASMRQDTRALFDLIQVYTPLIGNSIKKGSYFQAVVLYRELRNKVVQSSSPLAREAAEWIDQAISETFFMAGETERARVSAEALAGRQSLLPVTKANVHNLLGRIYYSLEKMEKAESHHRKAIEIYSRLFIDANASQTDVPQKKEKK